jgi:hypothetical protein
MKLLGNTLRLWVAARMSSRTEWLGAGGDMLDMKPVSDHSSPYYGTIPIPPVMSAQFTIIAQTCILKPIKRLVVDKLHALTATESRRYWFTIYLCIFILLHSCSMMTKRHEEYSKQINSPVRILSCRITYVRLLREL